MPSGGFSLHCRTNSFSGPGCQLNAGAAQPAATRQMTPSNSQWRIKARITLAPSWFDFKTATLDRSATRDDLAAHS